MKMKILFAGAIIAGGLSLGGSAGVSADCHEGTVVATNFVVGGVLDINAYLAAVQAALASCSPGPSLVGLPATGANTSGLLPIALGLTAVGGAAVVSTSVRRRSTNR